ncbi:transcriptional regulator [Halobaculum sp. EA56]|uniref:HVO_A0114 family putative DNA-binding protein n=1 Tax=Halobaculum sp. EA56 TaxID=3421648 RepID=UPI003EB7343C
MAVDTRESKAEFARRLASAGYDDFLILDREAATRVLTERREELIDAIRAESPASITALANAVDRDVAAVHRDLDVLFEYSIVEYEESDGRKAPRLKHDRVFVEPVA